jgi:hypothetical protein
MIGGTTMRWFGRFHFGGGVGSAVAGIGVILWAIAVYLRDSEGGIQAVIVGGSFVFAGALECAEIGL